MTRVQSLGPPGQDDRCDSVELLEARDESPERATARPVTAASKHDDHLVGHRRGDERPDGDDDASNDVVGLHDLERQAGHGDRPVIGDTRVLALGGGMQPVTSSGRYPLGVLAGSDVIHVNSLDGYHHEPPRRAGRCAWMPQLGRLLRSVLLRHSCSRPPVAEFSVCGSPSSRLLDGVNTLVRECQHCVDAGSSREPGTHRPANLSVDHPMQYEAGELLWSLPLTKTERQSPEIVEF